MDESPSKCPCTGSAAVFWESDEDSRYCYVMCEKCKASTDCFSGLDAEGNALDQWDKHVATGYAPHAGKKQPIVID